MSLLSNNTHSLLLSTLVSVFNIAPPPNVDHSGPASFIPVNYKNRDVTKCFLGSEYGCFSIDAPWPKNRPVNLFPEHPDKINPNFCLYTRYNSKEQCEPLRSNDISTIFSSDFKSNRDTFFVTHGYLESGNKTWIKKLCEELLKKSDANVVTVDWNGGSGPPYAQAVANIRLVGRAVAIMINKLKVEVGLQPAKTHLIGHSLGAHTSGYAGSAVQKWWNMTLGRITGLDPAEPHFADTDPEVRLDPSDAEFVDVIHTDAAPFISGGFGIKQPVGHVDFYPNGGEVQPGCENAIIDSLGDKRGIITGIRRALGCNHIRSYEFFTESVNTECQFTGVECDSFENYEAGHCFGCKDKDCARMGFQARPIRNRKLVQLHLRTSDRDPFCRNQYLVELKISNSSHSQEHGGEVGAFYLQVNGTSGVSHRIKLQESAMYFEPGTNWKRVVSAKAVGKIRQIHVEWDFRHTVWNPLSWRLFGDPLIYVDEIKIHVLETGEIITICPGAEPFKSWIVRSFTVGSNSCAPSA